MDNIVDYLVVLFFIVSFLSSIFKKKKTNEKNLKENKKAKTTNNQKVAPVLAKRSTNALEDFFKSINEEMQPTKVNVSRSEVDEYYEEAMQNSASTSYDFREPIPLESLPKDKDSIAIKSYSDSVKLNKEKRESKKAKNIRASLMQPNSIKNFIIMSEILGKPKALHR